MGAGAYILLQRTEAAWRSRRQRNFFKRIEEQLISQYSWDIKKVHTTNYILGVGLEDIVAGSRPRRSPS